MARPRNIIRSRDQHIRIPEPIMKKVDALLFSDLEQRIPAGAYQTFFSSRIVEFFSWKRLDLARFGFPIGYFISGPEEMMQSVEAALTNYTLANMVEGEEDNGTIT